MTDDQRALLRRVLTSRQFAHADSLKRMLEYLCRHCDNPAHGSLKEYDLAVSALNRPESFDPKTDPIVRVNIASIRERLQNFFQVEAPHEPVRMIVPKGQYRVVFQDTRPGPPFSGKTVASPALQSFWQPYFSPKAANTIVFAELLFFRDDRGNFIRNIYVNDLHHGLEEIQKSGLSVESARYKPSFHFMSAGEVHCLLTLQKMFHQFESSLETRNCRFAAWTTLSQTNLILLGSSRTNSFIDSLQGANNFLITHDRILNLLPAEGEQAEYTGSRFIDGRLEKVTEYAIVTQQPAIKSGCVVTTIAANHGRAIEGAGEFVSTESHVQNLYDGFRVKETGRWPSHFQILLKVDMIDFDEEVVWVEPIAQRILQPRQQRLEDRKA
jgi:hypothetical protein